MEQILTVVMPILAVAGLGYALALWRPMLAARNGAPAEPAFDMRRIGWLGTNIAGPCLLFETLATTRIDAGALAALFGATMLFYAIAGMLTAALLLIARLSLRTYGAAITFGNTGNLGLPLCLFAFGEDGLALGVIVFAICTILVVSIGVWSMSGAPAWRALTGQPQVYGAVLGALWFAFALPTPAPLFNSIALVGQMLIPLMLLTLGAAMAELKARDLWRASALSVGRVAIAATAALAAAEIIGLEGLARAVLILQAMTPSAVLVVLYAERYDREPGPVAGVVMISTALSLALMPFVLAMLGAQGL